MAEPLKKSHLISLGVLAALLFILVEWRPWQGRERAVPEVQAPAPAPAAVVPQLEEVKPEAAESQPIRAQLSPVQFTTVAAELGAKVQDIPFREGDSFKKGQRLVEFDCSTQRAQREKARAALAIAQRNATTNKKLLDLGAVGRIEYENSYSEFQKAKADEDELVAVLAKCTITAPFGGRVFEQKVRSQQFVQAGQPLLEILDQSALELEFIAPSKWASWLVRNHRFTVKVDETGRSYPAKVTRVGARIDSISQTIKIAAVIDGDYPELAPGMSGTLDIQPPPAQ